MRSFPRADLRFARLFAALALTLALAACEDHKAEPSGGGGGADVGSDGAGGADLVVGADTGADAVTWSATIQPIFATHCTRCHAATRSGTDRNGAPASVNFDSYDDAVRSAERGVTLIRNGFMPFDRATTPTEAEIGRIEAWIDAGFPE